MSDLTAADLARLEEHAESAAPVRLMSAWDVVTFSPDAETARAYCREARQAVPALIAAVRDLARAIVAQEHAGPMGWCPWCGVGWGGDHAPDCIVHRARALLGDSTTREG